MYPRCWLPRRSWRLEHNQCRSLYYFPKRLIALFAVTIRTSTQCARPAPISPSSLLPFSTGIVDMPWKDSTDRSCMALTGLHQPEGNKPFGKIDNAMGVTIELQNLGDAQLSREIVASIEHALSDKSGEWRVSIARARGSAKLEMGVEEPNGFKQSNKLTDAARQ